MAYWADYQANENGTNIDYWGRASAQHELPPGQGLQVRFRAAAGKITVSVGDLEIGAVQPKRVGSGRPGRDPRDVGDSGPDFDNDPQIWSGPFHRVPLKVELFSPGSSTPVKTWMSSPAETSRDPETKDEELVVGGVGAPEGDWTCRVTNPHPTKSAACGVIVTHVQDRQPKQTRDVGARLLNHAFATALEAMTPSIRCVGSSVYLSFGAELRSYFGANCGNGLLGTHVVQLPKEATTHGTLVGAAIGVTTGQELRAEIDEIWDRTNRSLLEAERRNGKQPIIELEIANNNNWKATWERQVAADSPVLHAKLVATDIDVEIDGPWFLDGDVKVRDVDIDLFVAFDPRRQTARAFFKTPVKLETSGPAGWLASAVIWAMDAENVMRWLNREIAPMIENTAPMICRYLGEVMVNLVQRGGVFWNLHATPERWRVEYAQPPRELSNTTTVSTIVTRPQPRPLPIPRPLIDPALLTPPTEFVDPDPAGASRLANINTFVVLMMENRSFDHMLGYLRQSRGTDYDGLVLDGRETNPAAPPLINPIKMARAPGTQIPVEPHHSYAHVLAQVADGKMSGFTNDLVDRGDPQLAMTYYTGEELPIYDQLAAQHCVIDRWFAAHPGPTWPNRFATMMGMIPDTDNLEVTDPRVGAFPDRSIFDALSNAGISWRYFESDLSFIRLYGAHRLDDTNVLPLLERRRLLDPNPVDKLKEYLDSGSTTEPRVIFIDPNFADLPPLDTANDDHPPADVANGQAFIAKIYATLRASKRWQNTLFLITYDEHGGFYDHVPPPGTAAGPAEWIGKVPLLHPDGKPYMGCRVPTFAVSPWVRAGQVSGSRDQLAFDHTSIIKTLLVRFQDRIPANVRSSFGPRVNAARHLGSVLQTSARNDVPTSLDLTKLSKVKADHATPRELMKRAPIDRFATRDFHLAMRMAFAPKRGL